MKTLPCSNTDSIYREQGDSSQTSISQNKAQNQNRFTKVRSCSRIFLWLWTGWRGTTFEAKSPHLPYKSNQDDCKACHDRRVACDHVHPQCSHCWSEQLLCFYVNPVSSKRHRPSPSHVESVSTQVMIEDATV